jgi:hypothetical protein
MMGESHDFRIGYLTAASLRTRRRVMSALPPKADIRERRQRCPIRAIRRIFPNQMAYSIAYGAVSAAR